jgi:hypothetical protein
MMLSSGIQVILFMAVLKNMRGCSVAIPNGKKV